MGRTLTIAVFVVAGVIAAVSVVWVVNARHHPTRPGAAITIFSDSVPTHFYPDPPVFCKAWSIAWEPGITRSLQTFELGLATRTAPLDEQTAMVTIYRVYLAGALDGAAITSVSDATAALCKGAQ